MSAARGGGAPGAHPRAAHDTMATAWQPTVVVPSGAVVADARTMSPGAYAAQQAAAGLVHTAVAARPGSPVIAGLAAQAAAATVVAPAPASRGPVSPTAAASAAPAAASAQARRAGIPGRRLPKPHDYFPFDVFSNKATDGLLPAELAREMSYVRDHCMIPPYPWGQVHYHDFLVRNVLREVPGDLAELGIGQGGMALFLGRLAKKYHRKFLAVDSFEGLPPPDVGKDNPYFLQGDYRPTETAGDNYHNFLQYLKAFDVEDSMTVKKAFFKDLDIPTDFGSFCFVHLDSDLYDSVWDSFEKMWDRISPGGCVVIDDFFHHAQGPARAVADFFRARADTEDPPLMFVVPMYAVLIVKGQSAAIRWQDREGGTRFPVMYGPRALDGNFYSFALCRQCEPFVQCIERSARRAAEAEEQAQRSGQPAEGYTRARLNAEAFLAFMRYPSDGQRSGCDIMRYLQPLEDMFDMTEGSINGVKGAARNMIEIRI